MAMNEAKYRHIFLENSPQTSQYTSTKSGGDKPKIPNRNRLDHADFLRSRFETAWNEAIQASQDVSVVSLPSREGVYLEFKGEAGYELVTKSLDDRRAGFRLLNVRLESGNAPCYATIFIPIDKQQHFLKKIEQYATEETEKGKPRNEPLLNSISSIRKAVLGSFWRDDPQLIPPREEPKWCEIWLRSEIGQVNDETENRFNTDFRRVITVT